MALLQMEFKVELFHRAGRRMLPTDSGKLLYGSVRQMLDLLTEARRAVCGFEPTIAGKLQIAACSVAAETMLPDALARFRELCPRVKEVLTVCESRQAIRTVELGEADLAIVNDISHVHELTATPIVSGELVLVVAPQHRLASAQNVAVAPLRGDTLIGREPSSGTRSCFEQALHEAGILPSDLPVAVEMNSDTAILAAVEQGRHDSPPRGDVKWI